MPVKIFQPSKHKEEIKQLLRDGVSVEECATKFPLSERTIYRYYKEVQDEKEGKAPPGKKSSVPAVSIPGVVKEPFTPIGAEIPAPPMGTKPSEQFVRIGNDNVPVRDFGYSDPENLLWVLSTFNQARKEYNFPPEMKMGDFCALLCQVFRMMRGWDVIGAGYNKEKEAIAQ